MGLPGLCGFIGEVLVVLSVWNFSHALAVISASVVILTAAYILWAIQRVYLGAEYRGPHPEALVPISLREKLVAVPLLVLAIWFGVYPMSVFRFMDKTIDQQVNQLASWTDAHLTDSQVAEGPPQDDRVAARWGRLKPCRGDGSGPRDHRVDKVPPSCRFVPRRVAGWHQQSEGALSHVDLQQIVESSLANTKSSLWPWFAPEVILSVTILVMLLARLPRWTRWIDTSVWAILGGLLALYASVAYPLEAPGELFTGMLVMDGFSCLVRAIVLAFTVLFVVFTWLSGVPEREDAADFYTLVFGSVVGMCLMITRQPSIYGLPGGRNGECSIVRPGSDDQGTTAFE